MGHSATYDIFRMEPKGARWCMACDTIAQAMKHVANSSALDKLDYLVMNIRTGERMKVPYETAMFDFGESVSA